MADKALLLGINTYQSISNLRGCENDVRNMARLLVESYGFPEGNVRQHLNQEVTKQMFADGFAWLLDGAQARDRLVLHFSGHGSNIKRDSGDEPIDELLCLYDMDIENPDTYLVDDDLAQWLDPIPDGVRLTVVLDTCHSGTGTRRLATGRSTANDPLLITRDTSMRMEQGNSYKMERQLVRGSRDLLQQLDDQHIVLARVYEYHTQMQAMRSRRPIHRFGQSLSRKRAVDLNHQLLAAASATQTAADAFIDNDYHGAFTYYFCQAARGSTASATLGEIMNTTSRFILGAGFSQTPQNEGPFAQDPPFGSAPISRPDEEPEDGEVPGTPTRPVDGGGARPTEAVSGIELASQMLRVAEKFIDLADYLVRQAPGRAGLPPVISRVGTEVVVYVHGISQHREGFSTPWWNAMQPHLTRSFGRHEVLWSPVVNPRLLRSVARPRSPEEQEFVEEVEMILEDRQLQLQAMAAPAGRGVAPAPVHAARGAGLSFDDFTRYMVNEEEREEILAIFDGVVRPLLRDGATIHLISHSWGTVVAWEGLRRLSSESFAGRVATLFVVGSALSIGPVRTNLRRRFPDLGRPAHVDRFYNLDARGDIVGGAVDARFGVDQEYLELDTLGCSLFDIGCAHSSYFRADNLQVNRDIFARLINGWSGGG